MCTNHSHPFFTLLNGMPYWLNFYLDCDMIRFPGCCYVVLVLRYIFIMNIFFSTCSVWETVEWTTTIVDGQVLLDRWDITVCRRWTNVTSAVSWVPRQHILICHWLFAYPEGGEMVKIMILRQKWKLKIILPLADVVKKEMNCFG